MSDLGEPYGEVICKLSGNVTARIRASERRLRLSQAPSTGVHAYSPEFRVAARYRGELTLYEADTNPDATIGADLLDIRGRVDYLGTNSVKDGTTEIAGIKKRTKIS